MPRQDLDEGYFISFDTRINPGKLEAIRVRLDIVTIDEEQMNVPMKINLCDHPLYSDLVAYVKANK